MAVNQLVEQKGTEKNHIVRVGVTPCCIHLSCRQFFGVPIIFPVNRDRLGQLAVFYLHDLLYIFTLLINMFSSSLSVFIKEAFLYAA